MLRRMAVAEDPGHYQPNLQACLEVVLEQSPQLIEQMLSGLKLALEPAPGKKTPAAQDPSLEKTISELVEDAPALKQCFAQQLRSSVFEGQTSRQAARQMLRFEDFQFLDSEQIDANIEFAQSLQAVQLAVQDVLPTLNAMVSNLLGWSSVQPHLNPLKPDAFVHALREALEEFVPERSARGPLMHLASGLLGVSLHHLYREVSEWLRSMGVEPVHMATHASTGLWNPDNATQSTVARTMLSLDKLRRLLSGELDAQAGAGASDFTHTIPASFEALQDMKLLEPMMKRLAERASKAMAALRSHGPTAPVVEDMLAAPDERVQRHKLGAQLGHEVVLLMLDNLMQDSRLLPGVRSSLKALEPELLRLSQQDGRLFSERQHPARVFLDRITHRSLAFSSPQSEGYTQFQQAFDKAVRDIKTAGGDAEAFRRVLLVLEEHWGKEEADQHRRAAQAARGLLQAEQRNLLAQRIGQDFAERMQSLKVPDFVATFLRGPWSQVVAQAQLNLADGSPDPGGYLALVEDLLWSVHGRQARRNRARLVQMVPGMLLKLRQGLELIDYPSGRMQAFFDALISHHEQMLDASRAAVSPKPAAEAPASASPAPAPKAADTAAPKLAPGAADLWMAENEAADSGYLDDEATLPPQDLPEQAVADQAIWSVDNLATGTWVDLALGGNWVRAQLTWTSPQRTLFMFISGSGMAHSMSRKTLERLKKSRLIRTVSSGRVMDNALDAVAQTALRNDLQQAGAKPRSK